MKYRRIVAIFLLICMLSACTQPAVQKNPLTDEAETKPTDISENETTEPTVDFMEPDMSWVPTPIEKPSHEVYFAEDRPYQMSSYWLAQDGEAWKGYTVQLNETGLQVCTYNADPWDDAANKVVYTVPDSEAFVGAELIGTDGVVACILHRGDITADLFLVDLVSGKCETVQQKAIITEAFFFGDVLYYAVYMGQQMQIVRYYVPTKQTLLIPTDQTVPALFFMGMPSSTQSPQTWIGLSSTMAQMLTEELKNPDSKYQQDPDEASLNFSHLWEDNQTLVKGDARQLQWICYFIQQDTGVRALVSGRYDMQTAEVSETTGVIDSCWFGSGYDHDHFDPDAPAPSKPIANIGPAQPFVELPLSAQQEVLNPHVTIYNGQTYMATNNVFYKLTDIPMRYCMMTEGIAGASTDAYYGITQDNAFVRIYADSSTPTVLYQGQDSLHNRVSYIGDKLYLRDGNVIVELDLQTQQYRTVFEHENLSWFYCDEEDVLYIVLSSGLNLAPYLFNLATGELTQTNYRL